MATERDEGRAERILLAAAALRQRMDDNPDHPNQAAWQARMDEYELGLTRLQDGLPERPRAANAEGGVKVDVPVQLFAVKADRASGVLSASAALKE